jgi:Bacterial toxin 37
MNVVMESSGQLPARRAASCFGNSASRHDAITHTQYRVSDGQLDDRLLVCRRYPNRQQPGRATRDLPAGGGAIPGVPEVATPAAPVLLSTPGSGTPSTQPPNPSAKPNFKDPSKPPSADFQWKGRGAPGTHGNWVNPQTGEKFNPDLGHPGPIGPHYDYVDPSGAEWRMFPDGRILPK